MTTQKEANERVIEALKLIENADIKEITKKSLANCHIPGIFSMYLGKGYRCFITFHDVEPLWKRNDNHGNDRWHSSF